MNLWLRGYLSLMAENEDLGDLSSEGSSQETYPRPAGRITDPFAFALFMFPAIWGLFTLPQSWWGHAVRGLLGLWLLAFMAASFSGRYGIRKEFGIAVLMNNLIFAGCLWTYPHGTWWAWSVTLVISFYASVRIGRLLPRSAHGISR